MVPARLSNMDDAKSDDQFEMFVLMTKFIRRKEQVAMYVFRKDDRHDKEKTTDHRQKKRIEMEPGRDHPVLNYCSAYLGSMGLQIDCTKLIEISIKLLCLRRSSKRSSRS